MFIVLSDHIMYYCIFLINDKMILFYKIQNNVVLYKYIKLNLNNDKLHFFFFLN